MARIKVSFMKDVLKRLSLEQISFSKMVELINEEAGNKDIYIYKQSECPFTENIINEVTNPACFLVAVMPSSKKEKSKDVE